MREDEESRAKDVELGRAGGIRFYVEIMVPNGPDDFEWDMVDEFARFEDAEVHAERVMRRHEAVRIVQCNDVDCEPFTTEVVWES